MVELVCHTFHFLVEDTFHFSPICGIGYEMPILRYGWQVANSHDAAHEGHVKDLFVHVYGVNNRHAVVFAKILYFVVFQPHLYPFHSQMIVFFC